MPGPDGRAGCLRLEKTGCEEEEEEMRVMTASSAYY